jgi:cellulose synthase/poly-beta-1,6-N-acetylglucosamine synthase-like glycosyltransferase
VHTATGKIELSVITVLDRDWHDEMPLYIDALEKQRGVDFEKMQVIVINGSGDKEIGQLIEQMKQGYSGRLRLQCYNIKKCGRAAATNFGIAQATGGLLLLLGDDFIATPGLVAEHLRLHLENPQEELVGVGPAIFPLDWDLSPFMHWLETSGALFGVAFTGENAVAQGNDYFYGANTSLKRSFLERAGAFDEDYPYACWDDFEIGLRLRKLGMKTHYLPDALACHWHQISVPERCESMRHAGESAAIMDFKQGGAEKLRTGVAQRRKRSLANQPQNHEERWQLLLTGEFNKAYKNAAKRLIAFGLT